MLFGAHKKVLQSVKKVNTLAGSICLTQNKFSHIRWKSRVEKILFCLLLAKANENNWKHEKFKLYCTELHECMVKLYWVQNPNEFHKVLSVQVVNSSTKLCMT